MKHSFKKPFNLLILLQLSVLLMTLTAACSGAGGQHESDSTAVQPELSVIKSGYSAPDPAESLPGMETYRFERDRFLTDSIYSLHFEINLRHPSTSPDWLARFLSTYMQKELTEVFFSDRPGPSRVRPSSPDDWQTLASHYYQKLEEQYVRRFPQRGPEAKYQGADQDFRLTAYPVWEDSLYITYRFYIDENPGAMHNTERDFHRTFEKASGRTLGIADLFTEEQFRAAADSLAYGIDRAVNGQGHRFSWIDRDGMVRSSSDGVLLDEFNGLSYPRPAIVADGIIFTYQRYEKGSAADGIIQVTLPRGMSRLNGE